MTVVDLHPEDLLEKEARGSLDASERTRLDAHLAHCVACRMELQLRADFAEELEAEIPLERVIGLGIERASLIPPARESVVVLRGPRRRRHRAVWLLAAAALLVGGVAAAAIGIRESRRAAPVATLAVPAPVSPPAAPPAKAHRDGPVEAPDLEALSETAAAVETTVTAPPVAAPHHVHTVSLAAPPVVGVVGPAELFEMASDARRRGDYGRVLDTDRELEQRYPESREAQVARAIVGRLLLDRGDPAGALAKFDSYLAAGAGDLGEEAMAGRAIALDRLGKSDDAARAWAALLAAFPNSAYAARARARLESSNGR
jgi:TolA-binding protein